MHTLRTPALLLLALVLLLAGTPPRMQAQEEPTETPIPTETSTLTPEPTVTETPTETATPTIEPSPTMTPTATIEPTPTMTPTIPFSETFQSDMDSIRSIARSGWPFDKFFKTTVSEYALVDEFGVRMWQHDDGTIYNHPLGQGKYAIQLVNRYLALSNTVDLDLARANAQRLIDRRVESRGAWFFPYPYQHKRHGVLRLYPDWYSALAQGVALSAFVRLYEVTGEQQWLDAADATFRSFTLPADGADPWVVELHEGYLWLHEFAGDTVSADYPFNGHVFALFGLYDYYAVTQSAESLVYLRGAIATVREYVETFRNPGWFSQYCLRKDARPADYHVLHTSQLLQLYTMTGDTSFAQMADNFFHDAVDVTITGTVKLKAGTYTGHTFHKNGTILSTMTATIGTSMNVLMTARRTIIGQSGYWLEMGSGVFTGYLVKEAHPDIYLMGFFGQRLSYDPPRLVTLSAGYYAFHTYSDAGVKTGVQLVTVTTSLVMHVDQRAVINGRDFLRVVDGDLAGYWLYVEAGVGLD